MTWDRVAQADLVASTRGSGIRTLVERTLRHDRVFANVLYEVSPSVVHLL